MIYKKIVINSCMECPYYKYYTNGNTPIMFLCEKGSYFYSIKTCKNDEDKLEDFYDRFIETGISDGIPFTCTLVNDGEVTEYLDKVL